MRHNAHLPLTFPVRNHRNMLVGTAVVFLLGIAPCIASPQTVDRSIESSLVTVMLEANLYDVLVSPEGERLKMEEFGHLGIPGAPRLPMKKFLIALPPGARAESIEILSLETSPLSGTHQIVSTSPLMLLPDMPGWEEANQKMLDEWKAERASVYESDDPFPAQSAWLAGRGTYRQYSYAAVAFCPFTYSPQSGALDHHSRVEVAIRCEFPLEVDAEGSEARAAAHDGIAKERASTLFFNFDQMANLYETEERGPAVPEDTFDYVIITTAGLVAAIEASDFPAWKATQGHNIRTVLTTDVEIANQPGVDLAEQIRNFLRSTYAAWGTEYVLFVGDYATVPMRICYPDPDFHVYDPSNPGLVAPGTPTDYYYADLSLPDAISWDSDGDGYHGEYGQDDPDFLAEVAVGRIPVNNPTRITYSLNKLAAFEGDTGAWKNNVLQGGSILFFENQNNSGYPFIDGATCLDSIETALLSGRSITHFTEREGIVTSPFNWAPISETSFTTAWRNGEYGIVNWSGHGSPDGVYRTVWAWDDGDGVPESANGEMQSHRFMGLGSPLLQDDRPSIVFAISCNVGYPEPNPYGNLGIDMLTLPDWGPSAGMVSSARPAAISGDWKNDPGGTEQICYEFNRCLALQNETVGDALYIGKFCANTDYGWDRVYEYMNLYNFNLFGDPSLGMTRDVAAIPEISGWEGGAVSLLSMGPNPFAATTTLRVLMTEAAPLQVTVHDVGGRQVSTLAAGRFDAGGYIVSWDGSSDDGERLAPGLYWVVARAGADGASQRVVLLK